MENVLIEEILIILTAIYEIIVRAIPTNKSLSIIGKILQYAYKISEIFDRKK